ncbi:MAG: WXG100 family type VII secretion target [Lachnospiraceae bacterium]|nr:WXG100 family type VII secretion target [Lachnospiraceae bacterium]
MSLFEVTSEVLRSKAEQLLTLNQQFENRKIELENEESGLIGMWEGDTKRLFHNAFMSDKEQMGVFINLIKQYVEALLNIAQRYEEAEARNSELASVRNY